MHIIADHNFIAQMRGDTAHTTSALRWCCGLSLRAKRNAASKNLALRRSTANRGENESSICSSINNDDVLGIFKLLLVLLLLQQALYGLMLIASCIRVENADMMKCGLRS